MTDLERAKKEIRRSYRARWNRVARIASQIKDQMVSVDPDSVDGDQIASLRSYVEDATKCFHEFNAYKNSYDAFEEEIV